MLIAIFYNVINVSINLVKRIKLMMGNTQIVNKMAAGMVLLII